MLQQRILARDEFLRLLQLKSTTLDQRIFKHELTFALGCEKPAHTGEYLVLDAVAVLLISMLNGLAQVELKRGAEMVKDHWREWLVGLARAERQMTVPPPQQTYFAVGTDYHGKQVAAFGTPQEANTTLEACGGPYASLYLMSLQRVIRTLRENARQAGIDLPKYLTPHPASDEFEKFEESIRGYQRLAKAKHRAKAKRAKVTA